MSSLKWIGLQPLPRPAEQWGWTCELLLGEDFEQAPHLQSIPFEHAPAAGEHFLQKFSGGVLLFPPDPMARVAERLAGARQLPDWALHETITDIIADEGGLPETSLEQVLGAMQAEIGVAPDTNCPSPIDDDDVRELDAIWNARKDDFFRGVGFRLLRTVNENGGTS